jgi:predicted Zn-dependent protease
MQLQVAKQEAIGYDVWSDLTFDRTAAENGRAVHAIVQQARTSGLLSAGYIESFGSNVVTYRRDLWGRESHTTARATQAQCSMTVRHPNGTGSGWAGSSAFDFARVDIEKIASTAFDKCIKSIDAVRIEPGRYQTILEPQATATFAQLLVSSLMRRLPESGASSPWVLSRDNAINRFLTKLGLKIADERVTISHDPSDPIIGTPPAAGVRPVTLIDKGVLTTLYNDYDHGLNELVDINAAVSRVSFKMEGMSNTLESMIESTKRGLLVSRVSNAEILDATSLLYTGVTRDGLWLIENGRITKAVRNFRWTESPLFIFNNIETIGMPVPVFRPVGSRTVLAGAFQNGASAVVVPPLKVNDFSFTSTIDAI